VNLNERKMVDMLKELREEYGFSGVKTEFELEGARLEEISRLKEITMKADVGITIKLGGCEHITGMKMARIIGVERIVAPMIESAFALKKFVRAAKSVFTPDELEDIGLLVNIETITGYNNYDEMLASQDFESLHGVVIGRGDMSGSMGHDYSFMESDELRQMSQSLFERTKKKFPHYDCILGGVPSPQSFPFLSALETGVVDEYESKKTIFKVPDSYNQKAKDGFIKGMKFELLWEINKRDYYTRIARENDVGIDRMQSALS